MILSFCESLAATVRPQKVSAQEPEGGKELITFPEDINFCQKKPSFEFQAPARNRLTTTNYFLKCLGHSTAIVSQTPDFASWNNQAQV